MASNCTLRVYSECIGSGSVSASQDGVVNGRPQYVFSFTSINNDLISGRIYWEPTLSRWYVEDVDNEIIISYLPYDRLQPYGTDGEWDNNSLLAYGCLSNSNNFYTTWTSNCPTSNFQFCCSSEITSENYFGIQDFEGYGYFGSTFFLETPQFSGCATMIEGGLPDGSIIYSLVDSYTQYENCVDCTGNTFSCNNQPIYATPAPTPVLTADTGCGVSYRLTNECEPITLLPLGATCLVSNVTSIGGNNGLIELIITGGTPPYTVSWENGNTTTTLSNLVSGTYNYTIVDYYGDFTIEGGCEVNQPVDPTEQTQDNFCLIINVDYDVVQKTFEFNGLDEYGFSTYKTQDDAYYISWQQTPEPAKWVIDGGLSQGYMVNYNPQYPPVNGWRWTNSTFGEASGTLGDCQSYGDLCMVINVDSFSRVPYKIQLQQSVNLNGKPSWTDTLGNYEVVFNDERPQYWTLNGIPDGNSFTIVNFNTQVPPINGWTIQGDIGTVEVNQGFCFSETICVNFEAECGSENIELYSGDLINGQQTWYGILPCNTVGDNWFIFYDSDNQVWSSSGLTSVPGITLEGKLNNSVYTGPLGSFYTFNFYGLNVSEGICGSEGSLRLSITTNNPISESDGGIVVEVSGGNLPYEYSIDGGTTYQKFPIFSNLKSGTYVVTVRDNFGLIKKQSTILNLPPRKVSYQVNLKTTNRKTVNTVTTNTVEYITYVTVTPSLPEGVSISFDILHSDLYRVSPLQSSSFLTKGSILLKNNIEIPIDNTDDSTSTTGNNNLGCQNNTIYITATTETWNNLTIVNGDDMKIITTINNYTPQKVSCILTENIETYSLSNVKILGCDNCEVVNQNSTPVITPAPNLTPTVSTPSVTPSAGPTICFDYTFSSVSYKDTKTPSGSYSGYYYYNLTNGVVWSNGGVYWYWSNVLGNDTTFYDRLYNGVQSIPNSLSYTWQNPFGSTGLMNTSLIGACS